MSFSYTETITRPEKKELRIDFDLYQREVKDARKDGHSAAYKQVSEALKERSNGNFGEFIENSIR